MIRCHRRARYWALYHADIEAAQHLPPGPLQQWYADDLAARFAIEHNQSVRALEFMAIEFDVNFDGELETDGDVSTAGFKLYEDSELEIDGDGDVSISDLYLFEKADTDEEPEGLAYLKSRASRVRCTRTIEQDSVDDGYEADDEG